MRGKANSMRVVIVGAGIGGLTLALSLHAAGIEAVLAVGGRCRNTVCVTRGDEAFVSQHLGDLDNAPTCAARSTTSAA